MAVLKSLSDNSKICHLVVDIYCLLIQLVISLVLGLMIDFYCIMGTFSHSVMRFRIFCFSRVFLMLHQWKREGNTSSLLGGSGNSGFPFVFCWYLWGRRHFITTCLVVFDSKGVITARQGSKVCLSTWPSLVPVLQAKRPLNIFGESWKSRLSICPCC